VEKYSTNLIFRGLENEHKKPFRVPGSHDAYLGWGRSSKCNGLSVALTIEDGALVIRITGFNSTELISLDAIS